jgi:trimethylamine--corrinoid protein Co-methyltransferase
MGRFYGLPSTAAGCTSDARQPGPEAVLEKVITTLPPVSAGADIVIGLGLIEGDQTLVLEQILVDNEIAHLCERLYEGVESGPGADLFDDIARVGPGGDFLTRRSTRSAARSGEFYAPGLIGRHTYEAWADLGRPSIYSNARERVRQILGGPPVDPLPEGTIGELDEILAAADRELAPVPAA